MKLAIVGSRDYPEYKYGVFCDMVNRYISEYGEPNIIISGGCRGIDTFAERYATENNIPTLIFYPEWEVHGPAAGPIRNTKIVAECTHLLAFPLGESTGTRDSIKKARTARKKVTVVSST